MKITATTAALLFTMLDMATARPYANMVRRKHIPVRSAKFRREVPQEHSHEQFLTGVGDALNLNNVQQIDDPVFALLGNDAAAEGAGNVKDLDCLQQIIADQAFTNAKEAGDLEGMTNALIYRALERNTASVGTASVLCTQTAKNPEIDAIQQHQDPASPGAAATNKKVTLALAKQLDSIGADPQKALLAGTFAPGDVNDPTGAGNTCDDANDPVGCIETQNLRVNDATPAEIDAAVGGGAGSGNGSGGASATPVSSAAPSATPTPTPATGAGGGDAATAASENAFTGSLGSPPIPIASDAASDKPFTVNGDTFLNFGAAAQRACDVQKNACANAFNSGEADFEGGVSACDEQQQECVAANA